MARKVIIDCDPGIDDAVALCLALTDPNLEVLALTAVEGCVEADQVTRNLHCLLEQIDPKRHPRIGSATAPEYGSNIHGRHIHGQDGLGDCGLVAPDLHHKHPSEKVICDMLRSAPGEVTIIALGPLTNIARVLQRDPEMESMIHRIILMGGSLNGIGNVTAAAEFNIHHDPISARTVFQSSVTKTVVPLDITRQVTFGLEEIDQLPDDKSPIGSLLRQLLPSLFRAYRQQIGLESVNLNDAVALLAATHSDLFETQEMEGMVETAGEITRGVTVFDRRPGSLSRSDMEVAVKIDAAAARETIMKGLQRAALGF
jgi:inosine-uridine nucleoside N-ribohydrolase